MSEPLVIDTDQVRTLATEAEVAGRDAGLMAANVRATLAGAELPLDAATTIAELAAELAALERYLTSVVERTEVADRFDLGIINEGWFRILNGTWHAAESELWATLRDDFGATAMQVGSFSLADAFVTIPRSRWMQDAVPPGCVGYGAGRYYRGGGAVRGPDGQLYSIMVPHLATDDGHFTIDADLPAGVSSAASLGGADEGWVAVGYRSGLAQFEADAGMGERILTAFAAISGLFLPQSIDDAALEGVRFQLGSRPFYSSDVPVWPSVTTTVAEASQSLHASYPVMVDGRAVHVAVEDLPQQSLAVRKAAAGLELTPARAGQLNRVGNSLGLVVGALQGASVAYRMNDSKSRAYEVIFEQNEDGRRRARVQSFKLEPRSGGLLLGAWHLFLDDDGNVLQSAASYQSGPVLTPGDATPASNGIDPDLTFKIGRPAVHGDPTG